MEERDTGYMLKGFVRYEISRKCGILEYISSIINGVRNKRARI